MSDLTVIYLTCCKMPSRWVRFHREHLLRAVGDRPLITISAEPVDLPGTHLIQSGPFCATNVYRQLLRGAQIATTKYIAVAEDDSLYSRKHFSEFRPQDDEVAYDLSRWSVFSWDGEKAYYSAIRKWGNFMMLGPRQLVIDALSEREAKWPNGCNTPGRPDYTGEIGRREVEGVLRVTRRKAVEWHCTDASVNLCHPRGLSPTYIGVPKLNRKPGELKAIEVPYWGKASAIAQIYNEGIADEAERIQSGT